MKHTKIITFLILLIPSILFTEQKLVYTLEELCENVLKSPEIIQSQINSQKAEEDLDIANSLAIPSVTASLGGQYSFNPQSAEDMMPGITSDMNDIIDRLNEMGTTLEDLTKHPFPDPYAWDHLEYIEGSEPKRWGASASLSLKQPLFTWGKIVSAIKMAKIGVDASYIQETEKEREVLTTFVIQLSQLYYLNKILEIVDEQLALSERLKTITQESLEEGLLLPVEALSVDVQVLELEANIAKIKAQYDIALFSVSEYTGIKDLSLAQIDFSFLEKNFTELPRKTTLEAFDYSFGEGSDLLRMQTAVREEQRKQKDADNWAKPDIGLTMRLGANTNAFKQDSESDKWYNWNFTIAMAMNSTIFDGFKTQSQVKKAELEVQYSIEEQERMLTEMRKKIIELDANLTYKKSFDIAYKERLKYSEQLVELKKNEKESGSINESDYILTMIDLCKLEIEHIQNSLSYFVDYCMYNYLAGDFPKEYL